MSWKWENIESRINEVRFITNHVDLTNIEPTTNIEKFHSFGSKERKKKQTISFAKQRTTTDIFLRLYLCTQRDGSNHFTVFKNVH